MTPMHLAISFGNIEIVKLLLKHGLDLNLEPVLFSPETPFTNDYLHFIVYIKQQNREKILKLFLQNKIDINKQDHLGKTALYFSSETHHLS